MIPTTPLLSWKDYQDLSRQTWQRVYMDHESTYVLMGLANEVGELLGKYKKIFRDRDGVMTPFDREEMKGEAGDVLWYLTQFITDLDYTLEEVAAANLAKLADRAERGVIGGSGDDR